METLYHGREFVQWITPAFDEAGERRISLRENGPYMVTNTGDVFFSQVHRQSNNRKVGPSRIYAAGTVVYTDTGGNLHRTNGPALIQPNGDKEYWVRFSRLTPAEFFMKYGVL